ncbi:influenza virus NS1A-binding protein-like protein [Pyrus ussuriensis x Pyrus communis]|uniref:Influenza virus NS1A-binding protein-like protein n=1 Tax=Pyrus ussuriensis x Pyrus communis TaxID=2448454 RepID=A0A5N5FV09_9ROSA|nr:influenza virus NS1A-binding protein-like protein [Pyrus ussuriensis x Pyrus communis]
MHSTQFHSVVVPRALSELGYRIQVFVVFSKQFLCAKLAECPDQPYASLCTYSCSDNLLHDVPKMNCEDQNPFDAAYALLDGTWFYVARGYKGNPSNIDPSSYLNSAERLNLKTWKWQALQNMQNPPAFASGFTHKGRFFVVGGSKALEYSAENYNPSTNSWVFLKSFVPKEAGDTDLVRSVRCEAMAVDSTV